MRQWRLVPVLALLGLVCGACTAPWSLVGFDAGRSGSGADGTITPANVSSLGPLWSSSAPGASITGFVVDDNAVFASADNRLIALEQATGQERWHVDLPVIINPGPHSVFAPPGVHGNTVYAGNWVTGPSPSQGGALHGYDATDGHVVWTGTFPSNSLMPGAQATDGTAIVTGNEMVANYLHKDNGQQIISGLAVYEPSGALRFVAGASDVAISGNTLFTAGLKAFDLTGATNCAPDSTTMLPSCDPLWASSVSAGTPVVVGSTLYGTTGVGGTLVAFASAGCGQSTCAPLWTGTVGSVIYDRPAVASGRVFVANDQGDLKVFPAAGCGASTCNPLWSASGLGAIKTGISVAGGVVFVGSTNGTVYAFDAAGCGHPTCAPLWHADTGAAINTAPEVAYGHLYVGNSNGIVSYKLP